MANNIIIFSDHTTGTTPLIDCLIADIGSLLNIKGYFLKETENEYQYYYFNSKGNIFSMKKDWSLYRDDEFEHLERKLVKSISLFPNPDLYIIDGLGILECDQKDFAGRS